MIATEGVRTGAFDVRDVALDMGLPVMVEKPVDVAFRVWFGQFASFVVFGVEDLEFHVDFNAPARAATRSLIWL